MRFVRRIYGPIGSVDLESIMRKLMVSAFISLDGVIQAPGGPREDPSGEFHLGGWIVPYADEAIGQNLQDMLSQPFELLLGRCTYDIFAGYWPRVPADAGSRAIADQVETVARRIIAAGGYAEVALIDGFQQSATNRGIIERRGQVI